MDDIQQVLNFVLELEKLKQVERKTKPVGLSRYENSAEHSWQIALLALTLAPYSAKPIEPLTVALMLLLHDVVEIDTGDKFAYDAEHDDYENEHKAAKRIFALLPDKIAEQYLSLWEEFEACESPNAQFAKAIDRLMPVLQNLNNECQSWVENDITISQILKKNAGVKHANPDLWAAVEMQIIEKGKLAGLRE